MSGERIKAQQLNAFVDGELELSQQLAIEARLLSDEVLRAEVDALRGLRDAVRERAEYHAAPDALRVRLSLPAAAAASSSVASRAEWRGWFAWRPLVPAFVIAGLAAWGLSLALNADLSQPGRDEALMREVIASHGRSTVGQLLVDVASSDQHAVKPWLSSRLDYPPPVADAPVPGASFLGGRVDYLDGRPVAALVYRQRQHLIDAYVWPTPQRDAAVQALAQRGFNVAHWAHGGMRFWLVSDINRDELVAFAQALAKAEVQR
ncbi:MAG: anti-sigma factor [Burkholderiales bacterium]